MTILLFTYNVSLNGGQGPPTPIVRHNSWKIFLKDNSEINSPGPLHVFVLFFNLLLAWFGGYYTFGFPTVETVQRALLSSLRHSILAFNPLKRPLQRPTTNIQGTVALRDSLSELFLYPKKISIGVGFSFSNNGFKYKNLKLSTQKTICFF